MARAKRGELLADPPELSAGLRAAAQPTRRYGGSAESQAAWGAQIAALRDALRAADGEAWTIERNTTCCSWKSGLMWCC